MRRLLTDFPCTARTGLACLAILALAALAGPWLAPFAPTQVVGEIWEPMSHRFWLGTDQIGRDLFSRMLFGARNTFFIAGVATLLAFTLGVLLGFLAAVLRGLADEALSRLNDLLMSVPTLIFALVMLAVLPPSTLSLVLITALLCSPSVFRISRALAVDIAALDFVEAARLRGESTAWIVLREILPNAWAPLIAELGLRFSFAVLFLSSLSFLGLGLQPPDADWGSMAKENKDGLIYGVPAAFLPAAAIAILTVSVNLVVDALIERSATLRRRET
jgi:peptide/nickel transport system permease protein